MSGKKINDIKTVIVFDTETTGTDCRKNEIIELGAVKFENKNGVFKRVSGLELLIKLAPGEKLPPEIIELTGITDEMLSGDGVEREDACGEIADFFSGEDRLLVAYNAQFDLCFLYYLLKKYGREELLKGVTMLDALTVYKDRRPYPHRLFNAIEAYGVDAENTHRAIDDAHAAWEVLLKMREEEDDLDRYLNLFGYNPKYGVPRPGISSITYVPQYYDVKEKLYETAEAALKKKEVSNDGTVGKPEA